MKVKVYTETPDSIERAGYCELKEVEVSTADLIAELEKRRPCERCHHPVDMGEACIFATCMWWQIGGEDKFKEAK